MNSVFLSRPPQSARFIPSPRGKKATKARRNSMNSIMMSSVADGDDMTSLPVPRWSKHGVMNLGFKYDEIDDLSRDSGIDDVSPVTSPVNNEICMASGKRKSFGGFPSGPFTDSFTPANERRPLVHQNHGEAIKINYGSHDERTNKTETLDQRSMSYKSLLTSSDDVIEKKNRSLSLGETQLVRINYKPRSYSQPLIKTFTSRLYSTLDNVSEEDIHGQDNGKEKPDSKTPLVNNKLTIYPGYQSQSGISLNDWQVKLGEKEPAKCRCDNKEPPKPQPPPPPPPPTPPPKKVAPPPPPPPSDSSSSVEYVLGLQASVGDSVPMTTSNAPSEIEGIQASFGTNRSMSEIMEAPLSGAGSSSFSNTASGDALLNMEMPPPSAGRRRKSLKTIFRLGFLNTKSSKKKYKQDDGIPSPDSGPQPPSPGKRIVQRRMSRLEMNEPIEDIFSGVKFETIQKRPSTSNSTGHDVASSGDVSDDDDIIEDPEAILRSIMDKKAHDDDDNLVFHEVANPVVNDNNDVISPGTREKEFLLPEADRNHMSLEPLSEESPTKSSEDDLR